MIRRTFSLLFGVFSTLKRMLTILGDEEAHRTEFRGFEKEYQGD